MTWPSPEQTFESYETFAPPRPARPFAVPWATLFRLPIGMPGRRVTWFESEAAERSLREHGLTDFERLMALDRLRSQRHAGRTVARATVPGADGRTQSLFVKLHWGRHRVWPRMSELRAGQAFLSLPEREWLAVGRVRQLGLNVPERLAVLREGRWRFRAAVVLRAVPPPLSLDEMIRDGSWAALGRERQHSLLEAVAADLGRIHAAGLLWRGVCTRHFFPREQPDGRWSLWLIDLEGIGPGRRKSQLERDRRKLLRALAISGADADCLRRARELLGPVAKR
jgi:hypothetical protein